MIEYSISSENPAGHYFDISIVIPNPDPTGQLLRLPTWIPGSYMIRDFAKNIVSLEANSDGKILQIEQLNKSAWQVSGCKVNLKITYRVYAWDLSVRGAHLDTTHGFFNGTSVFLEVVGQSDKPCRVEICRPQCPGSQEWSLATTLPVEDRDDAFDFGFGFFRAENYAALIDHPVEMGVFTRFDFIAGGIRHDMVLTGKFECDIERLKNDLTRICEYHIAFFGLPAPMKRYLFLVMVVGQGYGGLEHRDSTSLLCSRDDLPHPLQTDSTDEYINFLGLCSHEYFHSWNVKRMKPKVFEVPDLTQEVYTPLLWAFEGITSYYDDLALVRSGCIKREDYLRLLGQTITRVQRGYGRKLQSAAESSFNAWTKFYKQDENAANAIVSYYAKGTLIALCIDLKLRQISNHRVSLDDVMRGLWQSYLAGKQGITEYQIQDHISELAGVDLSSFLDRLIYGTEELPLVELLNSVDISLIYRAGSGQQDKGGKEEGEPLNVSAGIQVNEISAGLEVVSVRENGAGQAAGLSAGDVIIAINGLRADMKSYQAWLKRSSVCSHHKLHVFRRDELMSLELELTQAEQNRAILHLPDTMSPHLDQWLSGRPH